MDWSKKKKFAHVVAPFVGFMPQSPVAKALKYRLTNKMFYESSDEPQFGDVIFVNRYIRLYRHFGIYIGDDRVIHFAAPNGDFDAENACIHETSLDHFSDGSKVYVMTFSEEYESGSAWRIILNSDEYELQTPQATVARAKSMLGLRGLKDAGYSIIFNNCEVFAIWCKTNVAESKQVNDYFSSFFPF